MEKKVMIEPPWITSPEQLDPNDDTGQHKKRPLLEEACKSFRDQFKDEKWFVRIMATHEDAAYFVLIADARYMPEKTKLSGWMGYGVAVARVPGAVADAERKATPKRKKADVDKDQEIVEQASEALHKKHQDQQWYMGIETGWRDDFGNMAIVMNVDARYWKWGPDCPPFEYNGRTFHIVLAFLPSSLFKDSDEHPLGAK